MYHKLVLLGRNVFTKGQYNISHEICRQIYFVFGKLEFLLTYLAIFFRVASPHDYVIKWKHFPHYWPFVQGIHWSPGDSPHKGQWCAALIKRLSKQSWGWWFEMLSCPLWCHHNGHWGNHMIFFRITSLALGQSYDCPSACEATLKNMG